MSLRSFVWASLSDFGDIVAQAPRVLAPIPQPDFEIGPSIAWPDTGFTAHGLLTRDGKLDSGAPTLWRLRNVSVQRLSLGMKRYHVVLRDGICAADAYHYGPWIGRRLGDTVDMLLQQRSAVNGRPDAPDLVPMSCAVNVMDDEPIGAVIEEPTVLLSGPWQENYAHNIHEILSKFWCAEHWPHDARLLWDGMGRVEKELAALFRPSSHFVDMPANRTLYRDLWVPSLAAPFCVSEFQVRFLTAGKRGLPATGVSRALISRRDAGRRRISNEAELTCALGDSFSVIALGDASVASQMELFAGLETIILPHGAAGVNLLFAPPGARVVELLPSNYPHPMYQLMAKWCGHRYARIVCPSGPNEDMQANSNEVLAALAQLA